MLLNLKGSEIACIKEALNLAEKDVTGSIYEQQVMPTIKDVRGKISKEVCVDVHGKTEKEVENLGIIIKFLNEMSTQNNRATAMPYYYVIRDAQYVRASSDCYDKLEYYLLSDGGTIEEDEYEKLPEADDYNEELHPLGNKDDYEPVYLKKIWVEKQLFLTEEDAKDHLERNHYHYSSDAHTYVNYAWRAPKLEAFLLALFDYFGVERQSK